MPQSKGEELSKNREECDSDEHRVIPEEFQSPDWINNLTDDCLRKIFEYLPLHQRLTIQMVCRRWKKTVNLAFSDIKTLNFHPDSPRANDVSKLPSTFQNIKCIGNILMKCGGHLRELELGYPYDSSLLPIIGQHCCNLTKLAIDLKRYRDNCVELLPQMERLTYLEMKKMSRWVPKEFFQTLPFETLTELHLQAWVYTVELPPEFLSAFHNLQKLKALTLHKFSMEREVIQAISQKSDLTFLSLKDCEFNGKLPHLNLLTNLEHLNIQGFNIGSYFVIQVSKYNKNLRHLNISGASWVTDNAIATLQELPQLEELIVNSVDWITDNGLKWLHNLRKLECEDCWKVDDEGIIILMAHAPNLEYLSLPGSQVSAQVLVEASKITKQRTNNLKLEIVVSYRVTKFWDEEEHYSPLLTVTTRTGPFDGDDDDKFYLRFDYKKQNQKDEIRDYRRHYEEEDYDEESL